MGIMVSSMYPKSYILLSTLKPNFKMCGGRGWHGQFYAKNCYKPVIMTPLAV